MLTWERKVEIYFWDLKCGVGLSICDNSHMFIIKKSIYYKNDNLVEILDFPWGSFHRYKYTVMCSAFHSLILFDWYFVVDIKEKKITVSTKASVSMYITNWSTDSNFTEQIFRDFETVVFFFSVCLGWLINKDLTNIDFNWLLVRTYDRKNLCES